MELISEFTICYMQGQCKNYFLYLKAGRKLSLKKYVIHNNIKLHKTSRNKLTTMSKTLCRKPENMIEENQKDLNK